MGSGKGIRSKNMGNFEGKNREKNWAKKNMRRKNLAKNLAKKNMTKKGGIDSDVPGGLACHGKSNQLVGGNVMSLLRTHIRYL